MSRRRFNSAERVALWLAADGRCELCGIELQPGWHADHVNPFASLLKHYTHIQLIAALHREETR